MYRHKKLFQWGLVLLSALLLLCASGCSAYQKGLGKVMNVLESKLELPENGLSNLLTPDSKGKASGSDAERFAEGVRRSLVEALSRSERIRSARLHLLLAPGAPSGGQQPGHTEFNITLFNPSEPEEAVSIVTQADHDPKTGNASMTVSFQGNGETVNSGGIYFVDNYLLVQKADVERPLIRHEIDPAVAESYRSLPALERFMRLLSQPSAPKMSDSEWLSAINSYLKTLSDAAEQEDYTAEKQSATFAGIGESCTAITLTLGGEDAADAVRGLAELLALDPSLKSLFVSQHMEDEGTPGVTGMDGLLRDLNALTPGERDEMALIVEVLLGENASALSLDVQTGRKTASLLLRFFESGYARQSEISFTGFDGGGVRFSEMNSPQGGDVYTGLLVYEDLSPGGERCEYTEVTSENIITKDRYDADLEVWYHRAADDEDSDPFELGGGYHYSQRKSGQSIVGESSGFSNLMQYDEEDTFEMSVTLHQEEGSFSVNPPQFMEETGIRTADPESLYAALGENLTPEIYNNTPLSMRLVSTLVSILI